jgi:hypothetical protein
MCFESGYHEIHEKLDVLRRKNHEITEPWDAERLLSGSGSAEKVCGRSGMELFGYLLLGGVWGQERFRSSL